MMFSSLSRSVETPIIYSPLHMASSGQFQLLNTFNYTPTCWFEPFPHREKDIVRVNSPVGLQSSARVTSSRLRQVAPRSGIVDMFFEKLSCKEIKTYLRVWKGFPRTQPHSDMCRSVCSVVRDPGPFLNFVHSLTAAFGKSLGS